MSAASYLALLSDFDEETVQSGCLHFRKLDNPFPPSSGELFKMCEQIDLAKKRRDEWNLRGRPVVQFERHRLSPPDKHGFTPEELADWNVIVNGKWNPYVMRTDTNGNVLKIPQPYNGTGQPVYYGYLTPAEVKAYGKPRAAPSARHWTDDMDSDMRETLR